MVKFTDQEIWEVFFTNCNLILVTKKFKNSQYLKINSIKLLRQKLQRLSRLKSVGQIRFLAIESVIIVNYRNIISTFPQKAQNTSGSLKISGKTKFVNRTSFEILCTSNK